MLSKDHCLPIIEIAIPDSRIPGSRAFGLPGGLSIPKSRNCAHFTKNAKYTNTAMVLLPDFYKSCVDYNRKSEIRSRKGPTNGLNDNVSMRCLFILSSDRFHAI